MRKLLVVLLLLPHVFAVTLNVDSFPPIITPGTSGKLILRVSSETPIKDIKVEIPEVPAMELEKEGSHVELGDLSSGTASQSIWFHVPPETKPGVYLLPFRVRYKDVATGTSYEESSVLPLTVTSGQGIVVEVPKRVYGKVRRTVKVVVRNLGDKVYGAWLTVPEALGHSETYLGDLEPGSSVERYVEILPNCDGGVYKTTFTIRGYRGTGPFQQEFNLSFLCIPPESSLSVELNVPSEAPRGEYTSVLKVANLSDVPIGPVEIKINGKNVKIAGKTSIFIESLEPGKLVTIPLVWRLESEEEPGTISLKIFSNGLQRTYTYSVLPKTVPNLVAYIGEPLKIVDGKVRGSVTVANIGTGKAENVFVEVEGPGVEGGRAVMGDLAPGDYDTIYFYITNTETNSITIRIKYLSDGELKERSFNLTLSYPKTSPIPVTFIVLILVLVALLLYRRKRR